MPVVPAPAARRVRRDVTRADAIAIRQTLAVYRLETGQRLSALEAVSSYIAAANTGADVCDLAPVLEVTFDSAPTIRPKVFRSLLEHGGAHRIEHISLHNLHLPFFGLETGRIARDHGNMMTAWQRFSENTAANCPSGTKQCKFHSLAANLVKAH